MELADRKHHVRRWVEQAYHEERRGVARGWNGNERVGELGHHYHERNPEGRCLRPVLQPCAAFDEECRNGVLQKQHQTAADGVVRDAVLGVGEALKIAGDDPGPKLFRYLLMFMRLCDIMYRSFVFKKREYSVRDALVSRMAKEVGGFVRDNLLFFQGFDEFIVYHDGSQKEIANVINAVFNVLLDADIRCVTPSDYRLFQAADMVCTLELLDLKHRSSSLSPSELDFFRDERNLHKNNLKVAYGKRFGRR